MSFSQRRESIARFSKYARYCPAPSRYTVIWFRFLGLRKASALGYHESQLRCWSPG